MRIAADGENADESAPVGSTRMCRKAEGRHRAGRQLRNAVEAASNDDGWAALAYVGQILTNQSPHFDSRTRGYSTLSDLVMAPEQFRSETRSPGEGKPGIIYAHEKRRLPVSLLTIPSDEVVEVSPRIRPRMA